MITSPKILVKNSDGSALGRILSATIKILSSEPLLSISMTMRDGTSVERIIKDIAPNVNAGYTDIILMPENL